MNLERIIKQFNSRHIMVIGDLILDKYIQGKVNRISPEAPIQVLNVIEEETRLGGAANVAHNLMSLGSKVFCLGVIGQDGPGRELKRKLKVASSATCRRGMEVGIKTSGIIQDTHRPTTVKTRLIAHNQQVLRVDQEDTSPVHRTIEKRLLQQIKKAIKIGEPTQSECDTVLVSDYGKGTVTQGLLRNLCQMNKRTQKRLIIDPKGRDYRRYAGATAIIPNRNEAELATGIEIKDKASRRKAARELIKQLALKFVVITLGEEGIYLLDKKGAEVYDPARALQVYDVTGAGDTTLAAFGLALDAGADYKSALHLANLAAGVVISKLGTATVSQTELLNHMKQTRLNDAVGQVTTPEWSSPRKTTSGSRSETTVGRHIRDKTPRHKVTKIKELISSLGLRDLVVKRRKIVFTNGCFDILHPGHIKSLAFARAQGDILIVGLNSDRSVRGLKGGSRSVNRLSRPVFSQHQRANSLVALECVDYVVIFDEPTPISLIRRIKPEVLVKGADWKGKKVVGREIVESYGGKVVFAPLVPGVSTSKLLEQKFLLPPRHKVTKNS